MLNNCNQTFIDLEISSDFEYLHGFQQLFYMSSISHLERKLLRDFWQVRDASLGLVECNDYKILKKFPLLQLHHISLQGAALACLLQHGLD